MISLKSQETIKILNYYFLNPAARQYVNELARILNSDPKNLHRKLNDLEKEGLLKSEFIGKQRHFFFSKGSNCAAFDCTAPRLAMIASADAAYAGTNTALMNSYTSLLDTFNNSLESVPLPSPAGSATPLVSQSNANKVFWDSP